MRIARVRINDEEYFAEVEDEWFIVEGESYDKDEVDILPPSTPNKIIAVGKNYTSHVKAILGDNFERDESPMLFFKPGSAVIGHEDSILYHASTSFLDYEAELGVVMEKRCNSISTEETENYIKGYTCINDVTARDWQACEEQWARSKGMDTFCPVGPVIQTELNLPVDIECRVNGETRQLASTEELLFSIEELISEISHFFTLQPGDIIATGTPAGTAAETVPIERWKNQTSEQALKPGDEVEVEIESIGTLTNIVVE